MVEICILHALYKAGHLNVYHAAAVVAHVLFKLGQMRQLAVAAGKLGLGKLRAPRNLEVGVLACAVDLFLSAQVLKIINVELGDDHAVGTLIGSKHAAVFGDHAQTGENIVGRRFALAGGGKDHAALEVLGAVLDILCCIVGGVDRCGEGRHACDNGCTCKSVACSGRLDCLCVIAKLNGHGKTGQHGACEQRLAAQKAVKQAAYIGVYIDA